MLPSHLKILLRPFAWSLWNWIWISRMGAHSFNHQTTSPRKLVNLTEPLYTTTSLEMTPDTFHLPETLQDIFLCTLPLPRLVNTSNKTKANHHHSPSCSQKVWGEAYHSFTTTQHSNFNNTKNTRTNVSAK